MLIKVPLVPARLPSLSPKDSCKSWVSEEASSCHLEGQMRHLESRGTWLGYRNVLEKELLLASV